MVDKVQRATEAGGGGGELGCHILRMPFFFYFIFMVCAQLSSYPVHSDYFFFYSTLWCEDAAKQWHCEGM